MFISDKLSLSFEFHVFMQIFFLYFSVFFKNLLLSWIITPFKLISLVSLILLILFLSISIGLVLSKMLRVVLSFTIFVGKYVIGLVDIFELLFFALIDVRVILFGQHFKGAFNFILGGLWTYFQYFIVIFKRLS